MTESPKSLTAARHFFPFQDPLKQLKDLTQLRKQLEEIQRRVENEVSVGIPQVCCYSNILSFGKAWYMYVDYNCQFECGIYPSVALMENKSGNYTYPTSKCYWLMQWCCCVLHISLICSKCVLISCRKAHCSGLRFWGAFWLAMWWPSSAPQQSWACCWEP